MHISWRECWHSAHGVLGALEQEPTHQQANIYKNSGLTLSAYAPKHNFEIFMKEKPSQRPKPKCLTALEQPLIKCD